MAFDCDKPIWVDTYVLMQAGHQLTVAAAKSTAEGNSVMMSFLRRDALEAVREAAAILGFDLVERVQ